MLTSNLIFCAISLTNLQRIKWSFANEDTLRPISISHHLAGAEQPNAI